MAEDPRQLATDQEPARGDGFHLPRRRSKGAPGAERPVPDAPAEIPKKRAETSPVEEPLRQLNGERFGDPRPTGDGADQMNALAEINERDARRRLRKANMMDFLEFAQGMRGVVGGAGVGVVITSLVWHFLPS